MRGVFFASLYLTGAVLLGSLLAWATHDWMPVAYETVLSRSILLFAAIGLWLLWRWLGYSPADIGLDNFAQTHLLVSFAEGLLLILPIVIFFWAVGFRVRIPEEQFVLLNLGSTVPLFLASGALVALFEESLFRGVLFTAFNDRFGVLFAVVGSSVAYAAVHFLAVDATEISPSWYSGFTYLFASVAGLAEPIAYWDSFVSLFLLGVLLCLIRRQFGLFACMGLHAAWVFVIRLQSEISDRDIVNPYAGLVGQYDNFTGHLVSVWLLLLVFGLVMQSRSRAVA